MRAVVAAVLALVLVVAAAAPHVHPHERVAGDECALCTLRHTAPPRVELPDLAPAPAVEGAPTLVAAPPPVGGAPLGAIPGQSPPRPA